MKTAIQAATTMSVEEWFDTFGVAILKREEKRLRMAKLLTAKGTPASK
jgi:hypothetical protein